MLSNRGRGAPEATSSPSTTAEPSLRPERTDQALRIVTTQDLIVSMIRQRLLTVPEADVIKDEWRPSTDFASS